MMDPATLGILTIARSLLDDLDLEVVLERVLALARDLTNARFAALGVLSESRTELARFLSLGIDDATRRIIGPLPTGRGVLGELIRNPTSLRIADVGRHPHSYGFPVGHPPMRSFLGVPIVVAGQPYGNLYLTDKRGTDEFDEEDEQAAMMFAQFAGVAIDHARRFTGSEQRRLELQQTVSALDATIQIARALGGQTNLEAILELVAKRGDELEVAAGAGEIPANLIGRRVKLKDTVAGAALRSRQTQRLSDELNRSRFEQHGAGQLGVRAKDGLVVPLMFRNESYGVLLALDHVDGGFTAEHERLLEAFAASAATAVATARSAAEDRRRQRLAATEAERTRWARELHDETLQGLGNLRLVLAAAQRSGEPDAMAAAVSQAIGQLESDITNLRTLITDLRPATLDQLGIEAAIRALAERMTRAGVEVDVSVDLAYERGRAQTRHIPELETAVYRIVQEALTNATKHGQARRAIIEVAEDDRTIYATVRDDGAGFDPTVETEGFGLLGMHERADLLGGTLAVDSAPGRGATVTVSFPAHRRLIGEEPPQSAPIDHGALG
jgi:signal transduction histidine kinase